MHLTLHLTDACNLACSYCYVRQRPRTMDAATARAAVDMAAEMPGDTGLVFFGGEPLLCRGLIYDTVAYAKEVGKQKNHTFYFKITTNGTLLDEEFLQFTRENAMMVGFSHDGLAQDAFRRTHEGDPTFSRLEPIIPLLLRYQPYAVAMTTVNPETVSRLADSILWLFDRGFRYMVTSLNYSGHWDEKSMAELEKQYKRLAGQYIAWTRQEEKFYLSPFEMKIRSHIRGEKYCDDRCQLGKKQISVAPDGRLYPCIQFVDRDEYGMGDVWAGIDRQKRQAIRQLGQQTDPACLQCAIRGRCLHTCGCLNLRTTGDVARVSPVQCRHEQMLLKITDRMAETLYRERNPLFIHKHYNNAFPFLSLIEDRASV